jgi:PAS domain S-box-containing protein
MYGGVDANPAVGTLRPLHRHLLGQLQKLGIEPGAGLGPEVFARLLDRLSRSFEDVDRERYLLERSVELSSREMHELNAALATERDKFARIFREAPMGMARVELDGTISAVNERLAALLGHAADELVGTNFVSLVDPELRLPLTAFLKEVAGGRGQDVHAERRLVHRKGGFITGRIATTIVRDDQGVPLHTVLILEDVTERNQLEIELRHAQKLESVGRLAAGIAHEINTPIQFVGNNLEFLDGAFNDLLALCRAYRSVCDQLATQMSEEQRTLLSEAEETADLDYVRDYIPRSIASTREGIGRVAKIVQSMKAFAHPDRGERTTADINAALLSTITVAGSELRPVAEVETDLAPLPAVPCYLSDVNQVFLNLLVNAAHAVGDVMKKTGEKGVIRVKTAVDGDQVVISISDSGTGIPADIRDRIFDPFFTTKEVGKGTGQGLALARTVVDKHRGTLSFETEMGRGTTFHLRLPLVAELVDQPRSAV